MNVSTNNSENSSSTFIAKNISVSNRSSTHTSEETVNNTENVTNNVANNVTLNKQKKEELTKIVSETLRAETIAFQSGVAKESLTKIIEPLVNNNINIASQSPEKPSSTMHDLFSKES